MKNSTFISTRNAILWGNVRMGGCYKHCGHIVSGGQWRILISVLSTLQGLRRPVFWSSGSFHSLSWYYLSFECCLTSWWLRLCSSQMNCNGHLLPWVRNDQLVTSLPKGTNTSDITSVGWWGNLWICGCNVLWDLFIKQIPKWSGCQENALQSYNDLNTNKRRYRVIIINISNGEFL